MCTIIFIATMNTLAISNKAGASRGVAPWIPYQGSAMGPAGDLGGPKTPCLTKNETLVTALFSLYTSSI